MIDLKKEFLKVHGDLTDSIIDMDDVGCDERYAFFTILERLVAEGKTDALKTYIALVANTQ
jgi:hypothetical protein